MGKASLRILFKTDDSKKIPVDLVIDIGNSATCALLFENQNDENFTFEKVKKIISLERAFTDNRQEQNACFRFNE